MPKAKYSPCIKVCEHDDDGYCIGCQRTEEEVKGWRNRTEKEQLSGMKMLKERRVKRLISLTEEYG
jgi:predicted Fe-S protein YdhL (DUF1289 family)|tara:strand:+ start:307 stop:504 length:198 start_codon:yes stop_codon:yes gene_type:complete